MNRNELQAMRHSVRDIQKRLFESLECRRGSCNGCGYAYICETTNLLLKFVSYESDRYNEKGELKDDNN